MNNTEKRQAYQIARNLTMSDYDGMAAQYRAAKFLITAPRGQKLNRFQFAYIAELLGQQPDPVKAAA